VRRFFLLIGFFVVLVSNQLPAQNKVGNNIVGINVSEALSQFMPFGQATTLIGPYQFMWRSGRNGKMFSLQFGFHPDTDDNVGYGNVAIGFSRLKDLGDKFYWTSTQSLITSSGSLNVRSSQFDFNNFGNDGTGLDFSWGLGYKLGKKVSLFTEMRLVILILGNPNIELVPPFGIFLAADLK